MNKAYNDAVWSADGVRSLEKKIKAQHKYLKHGKEGEALQEDVHCTDVLGGKTRQPARGQGPH